MNRQEKTEEVAKIQELLKDARLVVVTEYAGLDVASMVTLRSELRKVGANLRVVKNTLLKIATEDSDVKGLHSHLNGPVAIAIAQDDAPTVAKILVDFKKKHDKLQLKAAYIGAGNVVGVDGINTLSKLPSRDELRAMFLSTLLGVPRKLVGTLAAVPRDFVGVLEARRRQLAGEE